MTKFKQLGIDLPTSTQSESHPIAPSKNELEKLGNEWESSETQFSH